MALTNSFTDRETKQVSPEAYAVIEEYSVNPIRSHARVLVAIYHDQAAREAGARPIATLEHQFGPEPSNPHYKQQTDQVLKAEFNLDVAKQRAKNELEAGGMSKKSADDFTATAEAAVEKAKANRDRVLGENWRERYATFADVFGDERVAQFEGTPDEKIRSSIYTWLGEWSDVLRDNWKRV